MLEKNPESPLDNKEIKLINPKGNQPWIFIGRTDAEAPILWPPDATNQLTGKDPLPILGMKLSFSKVVILRNLSYKEVIFPRDL